MAYKNPDGKAIYTKEYSRLNRILIRRRKQDASREVKKTILERYGPNCVHCGFSDPRALQLDHIDDNGATERESLGNRMFSGYRFYQYLIKMGLPDGYQVLCANCNAIKEWERQMKDFTAREVEYLKEHPDAHC